MGDEICLDARIDDGEQAILRRGRGRAAVEGYASDSKRGAGADGGRLRNLQLQIEKRSRLGDRISGRGQSDQHLDEVLLVAGHQTRIGGTEPIGSERALLIDLDAVENGQSSIEVNIDVGGEDLLSGEAVDLHGHAHLLPRSRRHLR